jgi:hypothetical protein
MKYTEFRDVVMAELRRRSMTWAELRDRLDLPYSRPCPEWVRKMEESGLVREKGSGRALVWRARRV